MSIENYLHNWETNGLLALTLGQCLNWPKAYRKFDQVLVAGVGGSAISGDILRALSLTRSRIPFYVHRAGRKFPAFAGPRTLVVLSSYSGNTEEIIESYQEARRAKAKILIVSTGGKLGRFSKAQRIPWIEIPRGFQPRCAIIFLTIPLVYALKKAGILAVKESELVEIAQLARKVPRSRARAIARTLAGKNICLYGASGLMEPVMTRWRTQLAENAKTLSSTCAMPEMFHNEIEAWQFPKKAVRNTAALFFRDTEDPPVFRPKIAFAAKHIRKKGGKVLEIASQGKTPLARIFSLILLGDRVSLELAKLNRVNPTPIPVLNAIKKIEL